MRPLLLRARAPLAALTLGLTVLTACGGISVAAGVVASLGSAVLLAVALTSLLSTQSGCTDSVCLSPIGPCLSAPFDAGPDGGVDADVDTGVGPCLSAPFDAGPDGGPTEVGNRPFGVPETEYIARASRRDVAERLAARGVLPDDVLATLVDGESDES
jgi:hypothetical protein